MTTAHPQGTELFAPRLFHNHSTQEGGYEEYGEDGAHDVCPLMWQDGIEEGIAHGEHDDDSGTGEHGIDERIDDHLDDERTPVALRGVVVGGGYVRNLVDATNPRLRQ